MLPYAPRPILGASLSGLQPLLRVACSCTAKTPTADHTGSKPSCTAMTPQLCFSTATVFLNLYVRTLRKALLVATPLPYTPHTHTRQKLKATTTPKLRSQLVESI